MEEVAVADLEAELGCLEAQESDARTLSNHVLLPTLRNA